MFLLNFLFSTHSHIIYFSILYLSFVQHPYIFPCQFATANENGGMVIRDYHETGSLRDLICKCKPKGSFMTKYGRPKKVLSLDLGTVKTYGRQILEALKFLHEKGFPYGEHLCTMKLLHKLLEYKHKVSCSRIFQM